MIWTLPGSAPARLRPRAALNASGAPSRTASIRNCDWPTSAPLSRPTLHFPPFCHGITSASGRTPPCQVRSTAASQWASVRRTSSASVTGAPSARTTSSRLRAVPSLSRLALSAARTPAPASRSVNTSTVAPLSTTRDVVSLARPHKVQTCAPSAAVRSARSQRRHYPLPITPPSPFRPLSGSPPPTTLGDAHLSPYSQPSGHFHRTLSGQNHRPATSEDQAY